MGYFHLNVIAQYKAIKNCGKEKFACAITQRRSVVKRLTNQKMTNQTFIGCSLVECCIQSV